MSEVDRDLLEHGEIAIEGRLWDSSNSALRVVCSLGGEQVLAVYKPRRGERPLWDFPTGTLGRREVATGEIDRLLGWGVVPTTVWREDGPAGPGSVQAWVDADEIRPPVDVVDARARDASWLVVAEGEGTHGDHVCLVHENSAELRRVALLDTVINNADRKGGHVLRAPSGRVMGIDHGLTFHAEPKLRTVLWGWSGEPIEEVLRADLARLTERRAEIQSALAPLLSRAEIAAAEARLVALVESGLYPHPDGAWPALPWPAM